MNRNIKFLNLLFLTFPFLSGCCDPTFSNLAPHKFIFGEKSFDLNEGETLPTSISVEGFENVFKAVDGGFTFENELDLPIINNQLFFADINCDGNKDICYKHYSKDETAFSHDIIIYDYTNKAILYEQRENDDYSGDYVNGEYYLGVDEENDIYVLHYLQSIYSNETEYGTDDIIEYKCYDTKTKFLLNETNEVKPENVDLPFKILGALMYFGTLNEYTLEYSYTEDSIYRSQPVDEDVYGFLRIDYEGTYHTNLFDQFTSRFITSDNNIEPYKATFVTDLPSKRPFLLRVYKFRFYEIGKFQIKMAIKNTPYQFNVTVSNSAGELNY